MKHLVVVVHCNKGSTRRQYQKIQSVNRPELEVEMRRIPRGEFYFLESLYEGKTIEHASITAIEQDSSFDLAPVLQKYLSASLFAGYKAR